jgi:anaerobic selenocysteine-containing dehydrogenase
MLRRMATHHRSCTLCEASCGVAIEVDGDRVTSVRGDHDDPFSRGYICPKAAALADLHHDPDRLRTPVVRDGHGGFREIAWEDAFDLVARRLREVRAAHGKHAIGVYQGNPTVHNLALLTIGQAFFRSLGTKNMYSATSADQLPHMLAAQQVFGSQLLMPVPDVDRCDYFLCLGGNPVVSNGSLMTAPGVKKRLDAIRARGGTIVVVDPRRTETAEHADRHLFIRPGTDALFLLAIVHVVFEEHLVRLGRLAPYVDGVDALRDAAAGFAPESVAAATGIAADDVRRIARELAATPRAVCYGRIGLCTQEFGGLATWLVLAVNAITGHLDEVGGAMFTTPAVDIVPLARWFGIDAGFARWRSRISRYPEFAGELPVAALAEEIDTPGDRQIRALITSAGNPVLSTPNGARLDRALPGLDFMVSIDPYINETTRHAHVILPPASTLESPHYDVAFNILAVRNVAKLSPPIFRRAADARTDWEICSELMSRMVTGDGGDDTPWWRRAARRTLAAAIDRLGPESMLDLAMRLGPHRKRVSLRVLRDNPHGVDLGALESRLPERAPTGRIAIAPTVYLADLARLRRRAAEWTRVAATDTLVLIGRRQLRSNNSWMHNSRRLVKGKPRCTLLVHPDDAVARDLVDGGLARVRTRTGAIEVPVEITDDVMRGVVSLPHGWGHDRPGVRLGVAREHAGASVNDVTDERFVDVLSGNSALSGVPVEIERA